MCKFQGDNSAGPLGPARKEVTGRRSVTAPCGPLQSAHAMFKRIRRLHISLAAKCQLLFGAAVVLIIGAALFVPWQRMEQLTNQLNERSARTLVAYAADDHVLRVRAMSQPGQTAATHSTTRPQASTDTGAATINPPRLILVRPGLDDPTLNAFEKRAVRRLAERSDREFVDQFYEADDGRKGYRFARVEASCVQCHAADASLPPNALGPPRLTAVTLPTTAPTTAIASAARRDDAGGLVGLVAVDMPSQIETSQLLLNRVFILTAGLLAGT